MKSIVNKSEFEEKRIHTKNGIFVYSYPNKKDKRNYCFIGKNELQSIADEIIEMFNLENIQNGYIHR